MSDSEYTQSVDDGSYDEEKFFKDGFGYGLAQWTWWTRKQALKAYADYKKSSIGDCKMQCEFLVKEIKQYSQVWKVLTTTDDVRTASDVVLTKYERPADQSEKVQIKRANYGMEYYYKYCEVKPKVEPVKEAVPACVTEMAKLVIQGKYGNGQARKENLYKAIQGEVNRLLKK